MARQAWRSPAAARVRPGLESVGAAIRGYRQGRSLAPAAPWPAGAEAPARGALEDYFDAHETGPGIWKWRHYFPVYERHLGKFVGREVHVVEIGVFGGGSLAMWKSWFGAGSRIYGVDLEPGCRRHEDEGIRVFVGDQADPRFWASFRGEVPAVDVVIDDGGHMPAQQIATLEALVPHIRPGGVYLCEDVLGASHPFHAYVDALGRPLHDVEGGPAGIHQCIESVHRYPGVTVIERPAVPVSSFEAPRRGTEWKPFR